LSATLLCVSILDLIELLFLGSYASMAFGKSVPAWFAVLACALAFALRGASLRWKAPSHARCIALFDRGTGILLFALFVSAFAGVSNPFASRLVAPYFLFGALALGLSERERLKGEGHGPRGKRGLSPAVILAALASAGAFLLAPSLSPAAEAASRVVVRFSTALEPYFLAFVKFLFGYGKISVDAGNAAPGGGEGAAAMSLAAAETPWLRVLVAVLIWAPIAAIALLLAALGLSMLFRRIVALLERRGRGARASFLLRALLAATRACARLFGRAENLLAALLRPRSAAVRAYAKLLACGRAAALARLPRETPREYASRLSLALPASASLALEIATEIEKEAYGGIPPDAEAVRRLARLRRITRRPAFMAERAARALIGPFRRSKPDRQRRAPCGEGCPGR
jgi:hypothetical protein